jgi:hypothetical protein
VAKRERRGSEEGDKREETTEGGKGADGGNKNESKK